MLNWGRTVAGGASAARALPAPLRPAGAAGGGGAGHRATCSTGSTTRSPTCSAASCGSSRSAVGCHEDFFDEMLVDGANLTRAIRYPADGRRRPVGGHVWAGEHGDINLITALPRSTAPGLQVLTDGGWVDAVAPDGPGDHQHRDDAGAADERGDPRRASTASWPRRATRASATASCSSAIRRRGRSSTPLASCCTPEHPQRFSAMVSADALDLVLYEINLKEDARRVR